LVFLLRPEAVTACLILAGPVLRFTLDRFSAAVILAATFFGLQDGYARLLFSFPDRPQALPVLRSTHSSLNHLVSPPLGLLFFDRFVLAATPLVLLG
jgi:hypothetical protein